MKRVRRILKWTGGILGIVVVLLLAVYLFVHTNINQRIKKVYAFPVENLVIPSDSVTLLRGKHLVAIKGCTDCHGNNLAGKIMINDPALGLLSASNLTKGKGGLPAAYTTANWLTAMRHGITTSGLPLLFMPSHETTLLSEYDIAAIIAYCQQIPAVDNELAPNSLGPVSRIMTYLGKMPLLSVEMIDHERRMIPISDTTEGVGQGKYLAISCSGCHRSNLKGGDPVAPGFPPVPDITSTGKNAGKWTQEEFIRTLRTGKTPEGHIMKTENMPWKMTAQYEEKELASLYQYLQSLK